MPFPEKSFDIYESMSRKYKFPSFAAESPLFSYRLPSSPIDTKSLLLVGEDANHDGSVNGNRITLGIAYLFNCLLHTVFFGAGTVVLAQPVSHHVRTYCSP